MVGRLATAQTGDMSATYSYDDAGRLTLVEYSNGGGAKIVRAYDDADRLASIEQRGPDETVLLSVTYVWNPDNTLAQRTEADYTGATSHTAVVTFGYDLRKRLITETRVADGTTVYDLEYWYDQLGNRTLTQDHLHSGTHTVYTYDTQFGLDDPNYPQPGYQSRNNRLLTYQEYGDDHLRRTVQYQYWSTGHVAYIVVKDEWPGYDEQEPYAYYHILHLSYASNGTLAVAVWATTTDLTNQVNWTIDSAWDFRYEGGRQRYRAQQWESVADPNELWRKVGPALCTDYQGQTPYVDYTAAPGGGGQLTASEQTRYMAAFGVQAQQTMGSGNPVRYMHGDLVGSTMMLTDAVGQPTYTGGAAVLAYTAFGEPVTSGTVGVPPQDCETRYQYCGGYGYETDLLTLYGVNGALPPITLQHVGARWYQPNIGRFVQRDPIGIRGGNNVYAYCANRALWLVDPSGWFGQDTVTDMIIVRDARNSGMSHEEATRSFANSNGWAVTTYFGLGILIQFCVVPPVVTLGPDEPLTPEKLNELIRKLFGAPPGTILDPAGPEFPPLGKN